jgi:hypothetical protein
MSEELFEYLARDAWHQYPRLFRPTVVKTLLVLTITICLTAILINFLGITKDAEMTTPGLESVPVPIALSLTILLILPLPCLLAGLILGLIPIGMVPYKVKFITYFLMASLLIESYALKVLIAVTING